MTSRILIRALVACAAMLAWVSLHTAIADEHATPAPAAAEEHATPHPAAAEEHAASKGPALQIPKSLTSEHEALHMELLAATRSGGKTAEAAQKVADLLHPHFVKEEEMAMPPLGLLGSLSRGEMEKGAAESVLPLAERLKAELPQMLEEHHQIVAALEALLGAAREEGKAEPAQFAEKLMEHARMEEEVLYPAAILVGEYLRLQMH